MGTQKMEIVPYLQGPDDLALNPIMSLDVAKKRLEQLQQFVKLYMSDGEDYGVIPGTEKPTLYKPGADKLCDIYALADQYDLILELTHEDWDRTPPLFDYAFKCTILSKKNGALISTGMGSCSSYESRYRYRDSKRKCPKCQQAAIIKGKEEYGGGWVCFKKRGGCGTKFRDGDASIEGQKLGRIDNEDLADLKNTIIKMARKRAKVDAVLSATRSSGIFTQDLEDIGEPPATETKSSSRPVTPDDPITDDDVPFEVTPEPPGTIDTLPPEPTESEEPQASQSESIPSPSQEKKSGRTISVPQQKRLFAIATSVGWTAEEMKQALRDEFGLSHSRDITVDQYESIVEFFQNPGNQS